MGGTWLQFGYSIGAMVVDTKLNAIPGPGSIDTIAKMNAGFRSGAI